MLDFNVSSQSASACVKHRKQLFGDEDSLKPAIDSNLVQFQLKDNNENSRHLWDEASLDAPLSPALRRLKWNIQQHTNNINDNVQSQANLVVSSTTTTFNNLRLCPSDFNTQRPRLRRSLFN